MALGDGASAKGFLPISRIFKEETRGRGVRSESEDTAHQKRPAYPELPFIEEIVIFFKLNS